MKIKLIPFFGIAFLFFNSLVVYSADQFILDDTHSYVLWKINHLGLSDQVGKIYVKGNINLDKENPQNSQVNVNVDINSVSTGLTDFDRHLKGSLFFDAKKYPTATYVSTAVEPISRTSAKINGILTMHGVSKPLSLMVYLNKEQPDFMGNPLKIGFSATAELNRSDFDMGSFLSFIGDKVTLEIGAEAKAKTSN